jgi:hypothetical protein
MFEASAVKPLKPSSDSNRKVVRELLLEYLRRVLSLWRPEIEWPGKQVAEEKTLKLLQLDVIETMDSGEEGQDFVGRMTKKVI